MKKVLLVLLVTLAAMTQVFGQSLLQNKSLKIGAQAVSNASITCPELLIRTGNNNIMTEELTPGDRDPNWYVHSGQTDMLDGNTPPYQSYVVHKGPSWGDYETANWINSKNHMNNRKGVVSYGFDFQISDKTTSTIPYLKLDVLVDDMVDVFLNEPPGITWPSASPVDLTKRIGRTAYSTPYVLTHQLRVRESDPVHFDNGLNTLYLKIYNGGSETGVNATGSLKVFDLDFHLEDKRCSNEEVLVKYTLTSGKLLDRNGNPIQHCINGYTIRLLDSGMNLIAGTTQTITGNTSKTHQGEITVSIPTTGIYSGEYYLELLDDNGDVIGNRKVLITLNKKQCCVPLSGSIISDTRCNDGNINIAVNLDGSASQYQHVNLSLFHLKTFYNGQLIQTDAIPTGVSTIGDSVNIPTVNGDASSAYFMLEDLTTGDTVCIYDYGVSWPKAACCPLVTTEVVNDNRCTGGSYEIQYTLKDDSYYGNLSYLNGSNFSILNGTTPVGSIVLNGISNSTYTGTFSYNLPINTTVDGNTSLFAKVDHGQNQICKSVLTIPPAYCCPIITANITEDNRCEGGGVELTYTLNYTSSLAGYQLLFSDNVGQVTFGLGAAGGIVSGTKSIWLSQDDALNLEIQLIHPDGTNISTLKGCPTIVPIAETCCGCVGSFSPIAGQKYVLSAWVMEKRTVGQEPIFSYTQPAIEIGYIGSSTPNIVAKPTGEIIDGWQRIEQEFILPSSATEITIELIAGADYDVYFDDIRFHPFDAGMVSYVYDSKTLRMVAELDDRNYATFYEYDEEGALIRVKKETERGIMTIQEHRNNTFKGTKAF